MYAVLFTAGTVVAMILATLFFFNKQTRWRVPDTSTLDDADDGALAFAASPAAVARVAAAEAVRSAAASMSHH